MRAKVLPYFETKLANLMLKTQPKQLLGSLPLDIILPRSAACFAENIIHLCHKISYFNEQVNCTEPFHTVRVCFIKQARN
jgi:hypothetical protein